MAESGLILEEVGRNGAKDWKPTEDEGILQPGQEGKSNGAWEGKLVYLYKGPWVSGRWIVGHIGVWIGVIGHGRKYIGRNGRKTRDWLRIWPGLSNILRRTE
jgi:hypothetical protein